MAGQDTSTIDAILKTVYEDLSDQIVTVTKAWDKFEELPAKQYGGKVVERPLKVSRTQGWGAMSEMGLAPTAGRAKTILKRIHIMWIGGRIQLSAQSIDLSQGTGGIKSVLEMEMDDLITTGKSDMGRIVFGRGDGVFAFVNTATPSASASVAIDAPGGYAGAINGGRFLNEGMVVAFINPVTGTMRASSVRTVVSVNSTGTSVTLDSAPPAAVAENDYIVRCNGTTVTDVSDTGYQRDPMGLGGLIDDGTNVMTIDGVNRTQVPLYQSTVIANAGTWSADVIQRAIDIAVQVGSADIQELWMHQSTRRAYVNSMEKDRRYTGADLMSPDGGTKAAKRSALTFGGLPIEEDRYHPYGVVNAPDWSSARRYTLEKGKWEDRDGSVLKRMGSGATFQHAFEAFYYQWFNFEMGTPNQSARIDGLSTSPSAVHIY
jgi:hypothetical protein